jgi:hypothetical protein
MKRIPREDLINQELLNHSSMGDFLIQKINSEMLKLKQKF